MAVCKGCQDFKDGFFNLDLDRRSRCETVIHRNFKEMSECADTFCNMCAFFRREVHLLADRSPSERDYFQDPDNDVHLSGEPGIYEGGIRLNIHAGKRIITWRDLFLEPWNKEEIREEDPTLEQQVGFARGWLATCRAEHKWCGSQATDDPTYLPTRVLDVGSLGQDSIRLVSSESLQSTNIDYTTLSYRWGASNHAACTTKENIADRLKAIPFQSLPLTLQDAVTVTRLFGIRFLWIDALCIIQGGEHENEEWKRELPNMGKIYRHSLFTIAASSAEDSSAGLFYRNKSANWPVRNVYFSHKALLGEYNNKGYVFRPTFPDWSVVVEHSPLSQRGWVLQERMLASRTLFWTTQGLFWQCNELETSEYGTIDTPWAYPKIQRIINEFASPTPETDKGYGSARTIWFRLLEKFSTTKLTVATDRIPAITGLGEEIARLSGKEYDMGVFDHNLAQQLAWVTDFQDYKAAYVDKRAATPQTTRLLNVPSWSWASTSRNLAFRPFMWAKKIQELVTHVFRDRRQIHIRGRLGTVLFKKSSRRIWLDAELIFPPTKLTFEPVEPQISSHPRQIAVFDSAAETLPKEGGYITCIPWIEWEELSFLEENGVVFRSFRMTGALIVAPEDKTKGFYRRIGWAEFSTGSGHFQEEPQDIILV